MDIILFTDVGDSLGYGKYGGTYKIATEIRKNGFSCQVIDNFSWLGLDRLKILIDKFVSPETLLIGFSCTVNEKKKQFLNQFDRRANRNDVYFWGLPDNQVMELISHARNKNPKIKTCAGGARLSKFSNFEFIDYCIVGKADHSVIHLINHLKFGTDIKLSKNIHSFVIDSNFYPYTQDEFSNSKIQFESNDIIFPSEVIPMEISRGCIFKCAFCKYDLIGKRLGDWIKNSKTIYEEMLSNYERFGIYNYFFTDEIINESIEKLENLIEATSKLPIRINYSAYARVDLINRFPKMRELLLESGAVSLSFGIETFNHQAGKLIGKGLNPDKVKETLRYCKELWQNKILISSNFIIGLPGESKESIKQTCEYLMSDENSLDMFSFSPLYISHDPNSYGNRSKIEANPKKYGYSSYLIGNKTIWKNDLMNFDEAFDLGSQLYKEFNIETRTKFITVTVIARLLSLGFEVDELSTLLTNKNLDVVEFKKEIIKRTNELKDKYYQELLKIAGIV